MLGFPLPETGLEGASDDLVGWAGQGEA
jgi:hypothetical protein